MASGYRVWGRVYLRAVPAATLAPLGALFVIAATGQSIASNRGAHVSRPVHVGTLTDRDAEVLSGLHPGDQVIVYPSDQVQDGLRVKPRTLQTPPNESALLDPAK